jgi:protein TonB
MTVLSNPSVPEEDTWQKPWIASKPKMVPAPTPSQVVITVPPHALPAPAAVSSQDGNGTGFRSIAQVSRIPQFKFKSEPAYPETAKRANIEGVVILQVDIDATGAVKKVSVIKGLGYGCDEAAVEAMKQSSFTPAIGVNGEPEPIHIPETYLFKFNSDSE